MEIKLKLCGMRRSEDIRYLNEFPPDHAGFILTDGFRRSVDFGTFCGLVRELDRGIGRVGVFVNEAAENVLKFCAEGLDAVQLHGDEDEEYILRLKKMIPKECEIWKAVRVKSIEDIEKWNSSAADKLLLDAFSHGAVGGTGKTADWGVITAARIEKPFFAAGGIDTENFIQAANVLKPYGIDLSGGIEIEGVKDRDKIREIVRLKKLLAETG